MVHSLRARVGRTSHTLATRSRRALVPLVAAALILGTAGCATEIAPAAPIVHRTPIYGDAVNAYGKFGLPFDRDPKSFAVTSVAALKKTTSKADATLLKKITDTPLTTWFGSWDKPVTTSVSKIVKGAASRGNVALLATYDIPAQQCKAPSSATAAAFAAHRAWVRNFVKGLGKHRAVVIVEVEALAQMECLSKTQKSERLAAIKYEVGLLKKQGSWAYIDVGHSAWESVKTVASRLKTAGIKDAAGFSVNAGSTRTTAESTTYGTAISKAVGGAHFVIDTSRNGIPPQDTSWCNPANKGLGTAPTTHTTSKLVDAYLWIKVPGTSDGTCNGGPAAGKWMQSYAIGLAERASW